MENSETQTQEAFGQSPSHQVIEAPLRTRKSDNNGKSIFAILIVIVVLLFLGGGAWYLLREPELDTSVPLTNTLTVPATTQATSTPIVTPTPTLAPVEVDKEEISIIVLNGTGIPGEAGFLQDKLVQLGYSEIEVGNASSQDNTVTVITYASSLPESVLDEIVSELEGIYNSVTSEESSSLNDDIEITIGLRSGQEMPSSDEEVEE